MTIYASIAFPTPPTHNHLPPPTHKHTHTDMDRDARCRGCGSAARERGGDGGAGGGVYHGAEGRRRGGGVSTQVGCHLLDRSLLPEFTWIGLFYLRAMKLVPKSVVS